MPHSLQGLPRGGSGWRTNMHPSFTFAPLLAIALNCQALLVPLHSDHTRPLSKLWYGDALSQDHIDLPSFHVQLLPLPDVDILQCQSRHDVHASISDRQKESPTRQKQRGRRDSVPPTWHLLAYTVSSPTCPVSLPALQDYASYHLVYHLKAHTTPL